MAFVLGLACALIWGSSTLISRSISHALGAWRALLWSQVFGLAGLVVWVGTIGPGVDLSAASVSAWAAGLGFAALNAVATLMLYQSLRTGALSLVVPVSSSYAAATAILALLGGERLAPVEGAGMGLCLVGVALALFTPGDRVAGRGRLPPGLGMALASAGLYGASFWILGRHAAPELGGAVPILMTRLFAVTTLFALGPLVGQTVAPPSGRVLGRTVISGVMEAGGFVCLALGYALGTESVSVVTVLGSLYSAIGALLAVVVLRERLVAHQWAGVGLILAGVVVLNG